MISNLFTDTFPMIILTVIVSSKITRRFIGKIKNASLIRWITLILVISVLVILRAILIVFDPGSWYVWLERFIFAVGLGIYGEIGKEAIKRKREGRLVEQSSAK